MKKNIVPQWRVAIALVCALVAASAHAAVGNTKGSASVTPSGSASYSIPIFAPPGTHGMTPSLSLSYSSGAGSGNRLNGDFVSAQLHTRMDPAIFGRSVEWMRANPLFSPVRHWTNRLPYMPGSILYGTGSIAVNCNDDCE